MFHSDYLENNSVSAVRFHSINYTNGPERGGRLINISKIGIYHYDIVPIPGLTYIMNVLVISLICILYQYSQKADPQYLHTTPTHNVDKDTIALMLSVL